jgi:hypothetical protein
MGSHVTQSTESAARIFDLLPDARQLARLEDNYDALGPATGFLGRTK